MLLKRHKPRIAAGFKAGALDRCIKDVSKAIKDNPEAAASAVVNLIRTAKIGRCLVLLPYDEKHNRLYRSLIEPAVSRHMVPVRLDLIPKSESIYTSFAQAVRSCSAVIADITILNKNVMYEIGYAHGRGLKPMLYTRRAARLKRLPVYFRTLNVRLATPEESIAQLIDDYLNSFKSFGQDHQPESKQSDPPGTQ